MAFSALHHVEHGEHECKPSWSASSGAWCAWRGTGLCRPLGRLPSHALLLRRWLHSRYRKAASESARDDDETPRGRFALSLSARGRRAMLQLVHCSSPLRKVASYSTGYRVHLCGGSCRLSARLRVRLVRNACVPMWGTLAASRFVLPALSSDLPHLECLVLWL